MFVCLSIYPFVCLSITIIHAYNYVYIYSAGQIVRTSFGSGEHVQKYNGFNVVRNKYLERHSIGIWDIYIYIVHIYIVYIYI